MNIKVTLYVVYFFKKYLDIEFIIFKWILDMVDYVKSTFFKVYLANDVTQCND